MKKKFDLFGLKAFDEKIDNEDKELNLQDQFYSQSIKSIKERRKSSKRIDVGFTCFCIGWVLVILVIAFCALFVPNNISASAAAENPNLLREVVTNQLDIQDDNLYIAYAELDYSLGLSPSFDYDVVFYVGAGQTIYSDTVQCKTVATFNVPSLYVEVDGSPVFFEVYDNTRYLTDGSVVYNEGTTTIVYAGTGTFETTTISVIRNTTDFSTDLPTEVSTWYNYTISLDRIPLPYANTGVSGLNQVLNNSWYTYPNIPAFNNIKLKNYTINLYNGRLYNDLIDTINVNLINNTNEILSNTPIGYYVTPSINSGSFGNDNDYMWASTGVSVNSDWYPPNSYIYLTPAYFQESYSPLIVNFSLPLPLSDFNSLGFEITDNLTGLTYRIPIDIPSTTQSWIYDIMYTIDNSTITDYPVFGSVANTGYEGGFNDGFEKGYTKGYKTAGTESYRKGYNDGKFVGLSEGAQSQPYTFRSMLSAVVDAPLEVFRSMFTLNILGIDLTTFLMGLFSIAVILTIIRIFMR